MVKTDELRRILHEASLLLQLPSGVGPAVHDAIWTDDGTFLLITEYLDGQTMFDASQRMLGDNAETIAASALDALVRTHREGILHMDIKPSNIFLEASDAASRSRLLDFGFATSSRGSIGMEELESGGTHGYEAPERIRGWFVDERADLYSLGRSLLEMPIDGDLRAWAERLSSKSPSRRPKTSWQARCELMSVLGETRPDGCRPRFGGGPFVGRKSAMAEVAAGVAAELAAGAVAGNAARSGATLVQGRPGYGVSRFLVECVIDHARRSASPVRCLDLTRSSLQGNADRGLQLLRETRCLVGVSDISFGLDHVEVPWIRDTAAEMDARIVLPALADEQVRDLVAGSLGTASPQVEKLGLELAAGADGDLWELGRAFDECVSVVAPTDDGWDLSTLPGATDLQWRPSTKGSRVFPATVAAPARILSHCPEVLTADTLERLATRFFPESGVDALWRSGLLEFRPDGGIAMASRIERLEFAAQSIREREQLDRWLLENASWDPLHPTDTLGMHERALAVGDRAAADRIVARAIEATTEVGAWRELLAVLIGIGLLEPGAPSTGAMRSVRSYFARNEIPGFDEGTMLGLIARAFFALRDPSAKSLAEAVTAATTGLAKFEALVILLSMQLFETEFGACTLESGGATETLRTLNELVLSEELFEDSSADSSADSLADSSADKELLTAIADVLSGRYALLREEYGRGVELLEGARERLRAQPEFRGFNWEAEALNWLARSHYESDPGMAKSLMEQTLETVSQPAGRSAIHYNLAKIGLSEGNLQSQLEHAAASVRELDQIRFIRQRTTKKILLAQALWQMDRMDESEELVLDLLGQPQVVYEPASLLMMRFALGAIALHRGLYRSAFHNLGAAWQLACESGSREDREAVFSALSDTLIDSRQWTLVSQRSEWLVTGPAQETVSLLLEALVAEAEGDRRRAIDALQTGSEQPGAFGLPMLRLRNRYHVIRLRRDCGDAPTELVGDIERLLGDLPEVGLGYLRAKSLLLHSKTLGVDQQQEARRVIDEALNAARSVGCTGVVADCLQWRAALVIEPMQAE